MDSAEFLPSTEAIERLRKDLDAYEAQRPAMAKQNSIRLFTIMGGFAVLALLVLVAGGRIWFDGDNVLATALVFLAIFYGGRYLYSYARKPAMEMQESFRSGFFPLIFGFIDDLKHTRGEAPSSFAAMPEPVTDFYNKAEFDDCISGRFGDLEFELFELHLLNRRSRGGDNTVFTGVVLSFKLLQSFDGLLICTRQPSGFSKLFRDLFGKGNLVVVKSGNAHLDQLYEFRSDNPDAANNLLGNRLSKALDFINETWSRDPVRLALREVRGYLLLPTLNGRDFFELPDISEQVDYSRHIAPIIADMGKMLALCRLVREATRNEPLPAESRKPKKA